MEADNLPRLENWVVTDSEQLVGNVYNDYRFWDGEIIKTTLVKWIDEEKGLAQTKNTQYRLGKKSEKNIYV